MSDGKSKVQIFNRELKEQKDYWLEKLSRELGVSNLRPDYNRPATYFAEKDTVTLNLPEDLSQKLAKITGNSPFLLYVALMTALKILLSKQTGNDLIVVGSPSRQMKDEPDQPRNVLVTVDHIDSNASFKSLLLNVRQTLIEAYARQAYPFERLIKDLEIEGQDNKCALFDVALALRNIHPEMPDVKNDITISFEEQDGQLSGIIEYNSLLFRKESIERFASHYEKILKAALANVAAPISDLELLTEAERHELLVEWNDTKADYLTDLLAHELFEAQAERTPDNIALIFQQEQVNYRELNRRANQLAHHLQACGVGPEVPVGICMDRSIDMIVAVLGALKAGGAYIPLDLSYPKQRLAFMIEDSNTKLLLTQQHLADGLADYDAQLVCLDADTETLGRHSDQNLSRSSLAGNLAYVIYTSGSTGQPKGVLVEHRGIANLIAVQVKAFDIESDSRVLQFASFSFDASVSEIFTTLTTGATLCLTDRETLMSGLSLAQLLVDQKITLVTLPSAMLAVLPDRDYPDLRTIVAAGERCPGDIASRWSFGRRFINAYGPTENTVCATLYECAGFYLEGPPIGRPILNTQIYLLDSNLKPLPVGVPGELCISGDGLARGYLNRPELTAEMFRPNPFGAEPGARMYKTGDHACYLPDSNIEFVGRIDHQVKIRGFRIELGEIEAALSQHFAVQQNVAAVREDPLGENIIVAYIVPNPEQVITIGELRSFLDDKLPDYMLPAIYVVLDELPLTPNGKVDRRALPDPNWDRANLEGDYVAARSPIEDILTGIWSEVLGVDQIGIHDSFFELRGHSLLATQVISRVREVFGLEIPLRSLFEEPTIAGLAEIIEAARKAELGLEAPPIERVSRDGELPLSFAQQRLWFLHLMEPNNAAYNVPAAIRLTGTLDVEALTKTLSEIVRRHEVLRTTFATVNDRPVQQIAPAEAVTLPVLDLSQLPEAERESRALELANEEAKRPFDLTRDPVMRVTLLRLSDQEHVMLFTMHHIVSDGWSVSVLFNEIRELYTAFLAGKESPLPELAIQYADFAHWQREWMQGEVLRKQLGYWKEQLKGKLPVMELPTDRARPEAQSYRGGAQYLEVKAELAAELKRVSRQEGVTLFMTLLAGFKTLLYRYCGQEDIIVGSNIANRNRSEIGNLIGYFVNTLVLRTDLSGDPTFRELLARVREMALGAYAHQDLPFEKLVEQLHPQRDPSRSPLVQLMFDFHEYSDDIFSNPSTSLPGLTQSPLATEPASEKFDLVLNMHSSNEGLYGAFQYSLDLFDASTVNRMLQQFETILSNVAANPDIRLSALKETLIEADKQQQILDRKGFKEARRKMLQGVKQKSYSKINN